MRWRNLALLAVLVGGLAFLARIRMREEAAGVGRVPDVRPLLPGLAPDRVSTIRIDSLARAVQVRLERDAVGSWFLTDPVAYPAEDGVARAILRTVATATVTSADGVGLDDASLAPPRAVLELVEQAPEGERTWRVAIGGVDLDPDRVFVQVSEGAEEAGEVQLATRAIANLLERSPEDYRSRRTTTMLGQDVVALRRAGTAFVADRGGEIDLFLDAEETGAGWRTRGERVVSLDPNGMGLLATGAASLRVDRFRDDHPEDLSVYGLDPPAFTIHLVSRNGTEETLAFGVPPIVGPREAAPDTWYCRRVGLPHVFEVDGEDVALLIRPVEDFYDAFLVRAKRESIARVVLANGEGGLVLERAEDGRGRGAWKVGVPSAKGADPEVFFPAESGPVEDVLSALERTELEFPDGVTFADSDPPRSLTVTTREGMRFGGRIGVSHTDRELGIEGSLFLRFGDNVPALLDRSVVELFDLAPESFRSRRIHRVRPEDVRSVHLVAEDRVLVYRHPNDRDWFVGTTRFVAPKAFRNSLFTLLALRAEHWLDPGEAPSLRDRIEVSLETQPGLPAVAFTLGRDEEGNLICLEGDLAARVDPEQLAKHREAWGEDLLDALRGLFE